MNKKTPVVNGLKAHISPPILFWIRICLKNSVKFHLRYIGLKLSEYFTGIHVLLYCRPGDSIVLCDACCCRADTSLDFTVIANNTSRSRELSLHVCFSPQFLLSLFHFDIVFPSYISNFRLLTRRKKTEERNTIDAIVLFLV